MVIIGKIDEVRAVLNDLCMVHGGGTPIGKDLNGVKIVCDSVKCGGADREGQADI